MAEKTIDRNSDLELWPISELITTAPNCKIDVMGIVSRSFHVDPQKHKQKYLLTFTIKGMKLISWSHNFLHLK